ncbi:MAG: hypothetical protein DRO11_04475 [Methanobacteriota archaeon]|nr:MAG: hypothetical protein DRO11_04475 [Euryarchaeota archaeon]
MEAMPMKMILIATLFAATLGIGFKALNYATQTREETFAIQTMNALVSDARMVSMGAVGTKTLTTVKLVGNSKIVFSNEKLVDPATGETNWQGRIDIELSNGNVLVEILPLPIDVDDGTNQLGAMRLVDGCLKLGGEGKTRLEEFFAAGEYSLKITHKRAVKTNWKGTNNPGACDKQGSDYLEIKLY